MTPSSFLPTRQRTRTHFRTRTTLGKVFCIALLLSVCCSIGALPSAMACTTAVISGRATASGRPLLWKNRDTSNTHNEVVHFNDGPIPFVAVVDAGKRSAVWMGVNEAGFCVENALSKDLSDQAPSTGMGNGSFMKKALATCRTVDDFARLLRETDQTGRKTTANFGVIDAHGGAAIFESGPKSHAMFDVNDPIVAPDGFLVRSNFATTAQGLPGNPATDHLPSFYSGQRYCRAKVLIQDQLPLGITALFVMRHLCRDLADPNGLAYPGPVNNTVGVLPTELNTDATISRSTTVSAVVIEGVAEGEDPRTTTMWTLLGDPKFTIAVPCWPSVTDIAESMAEPTGAEIGEVALLLREWCIDGREDTIDTRALPGIWKDILPLEHKFYSETSDAIDSYRVSGLDVSTLTRLHQQTAYEAFGAMRRELDELKEEVLAGMQTASIANTNDPTTVSDGRLRVAICDHTDQPTKGAANLLRILNESAGFETRRVTSVQIAEGILDGYDIVIMPGGSGSAQAKRLGDEGRQAIQNFVSGGGGYVGICAGAYLASSQYSWSLNLINARVFDRQHWARGQADVQLQMTAAGSDSLQADEIVGVYYGQGPLLLPDDHDDLPAYEVLARYETEVALKGAPEGAMVDTHAIVCSTFGNGRVICFSPHPETATGPNQLITAGVRWAGGSATTP